MYLLRTTTDRRSVAMRDFIIGGIEAMSYMFVVVTTIVSIIGVGAGSENIFMGIVIGGMLGLAISVPVTGLVFILLDIRDSSLRIEGYLKPMTRSAAR